MYEPRSIHNLIYGEEQDLEQEFDETGRETEPQNDPDDEAKTWTRPSLYVEVLERAINTIKSTEGEKRLFTHEEWCFLETIADLDYHVRFILIRLILRKPGRWYRLVNLQKYVSEVGQDGLLDAFEKLAKPLRPEPSPTEVEIIDLTLDSDNEDADSHVQPVAGPSNSSVTNEDSEICMDYFCKNEMDLSMLEGLRVLNVDELKSLCKIFQIPTAKSTVSALAEYSLIDRTSTQSLIAFESPGPKGKGKQRDTGLRQSILPFASARVSRIQTDRLRQLMLKTIGKAIRVNPYIHVLILRLHLLWFRSTEIPDSLFGPALLAGFKKRTYAQYNFARDPDIWCSREQYLEYETALRIEATIDDILKLEPKFGRAKASASAMMERFSTPVIPGLDFMRRVTTPARTPHLPDALGARNEYDVLDSGVFEDTPAQQNARMVKKILEEHVLPKWKDLVATESARTMTRRPGLERFEPGYVYTRIVGKCTHALATLKEFASENDLLDALLEQRLWRRGRRGHWYDRRALIQMRYLYKDSDGTKNMSVLRDARDDIIKALEDEDTAMVFRPSLIHRLHGVEKMLKLSAEEKAKHEDVTLKKPVEVDVVAVRIWDHPDSVKLDATGKVASKENKTVDAPSIVNYLVTPTRSPDLARRDTPEPRRSWTGKSLWQGKDGTVNVEIRALQDYEERGFKGFHSETRILTTLFGLLFWDIIFAQVPGAFETPWQLGPLDIGEDSFYYARREHIDKRLAEIKNGQARNILEANDGRHREHKTCCIGVSWEMCSRDDLVEIVECLGGDVLASICRLFCEDYGGRSSGVPDLVVWNPETKECKFVEVKGPGDSLQENQKLWSHALLTAQCQVEVCHVMQAKDMEKKLAKQAKKALKTPKPRGKPTTATLTASGTNKGRGQSRANGVSVESDSEENIQDAYLVDEDAAWVPSTEISEKLPHRELKRRRRTTENDELPVFVEPEVYSAPPGLERGEIVLASSSKKRRTI
ncbi:VRR-NUC domain-containing protein [Mycena pura]|uniref:Fanconi-associated nuclease n=1 Tax=Mycena pura TaxID=153505 RepID=A0AAD6VFF3_9AGAR|nr:VRR-NUC domain-containing protein [Mycena pura]